MDINTNLGKVVDDRFNELLIFQYNESVKFKQYCKLLFDKVEEVRLAHQQIRDERFLYNAVGKNLDVVGELIGAARTPLEFPFEYFGWFGLSSSYQLGSAGDAGVGRPFKSVSEDSRSNSTVPLSDTLYRKALYGQVVVNTSSLDLNSVRQIILSVITSNTDVTIETGTSGVFSYTVTFPNKLSSDEKSLIAEGAIPRPASVRAFYEDPDGPITIIY